MVRKLDGGGAMVRIWRVEFGWSTANVDVEAQTVDEAIGKAKEHFKKEIKRAPDDYWISGAELLAESDI